MRDPHRRPLDEKAFRQVRALGTTPQQLLIVPFDENAGGRVKPIFTIVVGAKVRPGVYGERLNHYRLPRTIEEAYGLPALGRAKRVRPLSAIWTTLRRGTSNSIDRCTSGSQTGIAWATALTER